MNELMMNMTMIVCILWFLFIQVHTNRCIYSHDRCINSVLITLRSLTINFHSTNKNFYPLPFFLFLVESCEAVCYAFV